MNNVWLFLGGITFVILFFWTPFINIFLWVLMLILGCSYFISVHLRKHRNATGKWVMDWNIFWENMLLGGMVLSCFTLYLFRGLELLPIIMAGLLLSVALYSGLMALKKADGIQ